MVSFDTVGVPPPVGSCDGYAVPVGPSVWSVVGVDIMNSIAGAVVGDRGKDNAGARVSTAVAGVVGRSVSPPPLFVGNAGSRVLAKTATVGIPVGKDVVGRKVSILPVGILVGRVMK